MDKNAIKKFAVWARTELIARVSLKGVEYGITEDNIVDAAADNINGKVLTDTEKKQRMACIAEINDKGYKQVMEEVAYTWFNRFSALRFMEVNGYLPSHVRVFTNEENIFKPQIITEAIHLDLDRLDMKKVYELKEAEKTEELYKYLLIVQCNALNKILPGMFQKISDYTEILLPDNLLRDGSVIQQMIELIPEDEWKDAVQIIGWLYQYYNSEKKDDVFAALKKNVKITKENIPAATQLFTPDWIVRYMVENSLGRLWLEGHPDAKEQLLPTEEEQSAYVAGNRDPEDTKWHYYLEEAEQEPEVQAQLAEIRKEYAALTPEQLKVIDPCCGSGHILAYMFDVLMKIYESYGYTTREAVASIVENNIYGLDIDDRAAQLAYFAVMMKARQYDRRFFSRGIQPHVYAIVESNHVDKFAVEYFCNGDAKLKEAMDIIISELYDAKEYGSILTVTPQDWTMLYNRFAEIMEDINMSREAVLGELLPLVLVAETLAQGYDVIVTNPPYMGNNGMDGTLVEFVKRNYPDTKSDMSTVCMEKTLNMCKATGFMSMINIPVWMFLASYEKLRNSILQTNSVVNMVHLGRGVFGSDFGTTTFVISKKYYNSYKGVYRRLFEKQGAVDSVEVKEKRFFEGRGKFISCQENFDTIPGSPFAYWVSKSLLSAFSKQYFVGDFCEPRVGMATANNERFIRLWYEVSGDKIGMNMANREEALLSHKKWFPFAKGGECRKWYGNNAYLVNWENDGYEIRNFKDEKTGRIRSHNYNLDFIFQDAITWTVISSATTSFRYCPKGFLYSNSGYGMFFLAKEDLIPTLGFLNTNVVMNILNILSPTIGFESGYLRKIPYLQTNQAVNKIVEENIKLSQNDWDSFETSWDFQHHPLLREVPTISEAFDQWQIECDNRFNHLKDNEEELNRIFIDIYGLQDELTPEVEDKDVTVRKADLGRDIRSFISYAVGCMFGRYSLDVDGLAYAGGEWDKVNSSEGGREGTLGCASKYASFPADKDNIIPICDDEYFEDDIVGLFVEFVKTVYGTDTLDESLKFIADALGGKGQPKDVIRNYFLNDFYADHCKIYQKRPIYWLFDSGKKNGFKALIYMHRYQPDTIARIRTDYVHEQQARYRTAIADLEQRIANASTSEHVKLNRKLTALQAQDAEIRIYEEKIHHLADQMISIDLDDGVKKNYAIFQDVLAKIK
ncbi:BREX-1 system adenine-specific DNA-methyltransferase PglX [Schaedlerella arabinosiphila]|uniref:BREX-1 system adenine-specific DNA-methyltransferase PglX n=1 Tax=Schaedlerella arabinosiphila TaxID=2044587 RepID=UPI002558039B|nr:BREX-1 system adenine-specific DNA-methyltransferase PglX [Schaedlerella arabinosiphila]